MSIIYIFIIFFFHILFNYASKVRAACTIVPDNDGSKAIKHLLGCRGGEGQ